MFQSWQTLNPQLIILRNTLGKRIKKQKTDRVLPNISSSRRMRAGELKWAKVDQFNN